MNGSFNSSFLPSTQPLKHGSFGRPATLFREGSGVSDVQGFPRPGGGGAGQCRFPGGYWRFNTNTNQSATVSNGDRDYPLSGPTPERSRSNRRQALVNDPPAPNLQTASRPVSDHRSG